jgi:hypothetical protein
MYIDGWLNRRIAIRSKFHTVCPCKYAQFLLLKKNHRESTIERVTNAETVQDDEETAPIARGRGKTLENEERNANLQALLSHTKNSKLKHGTVGLVPKQFIGSLSTRFGR